MLEIIKSTRRPDDYDSMILHYEVFVGLYLLTVKLRDIVTINMVVDEFKRFSETNCPKPGSKAISLAFDSTLEGDGLRQLLVETYVYDVNELPEGDYLRDFLQLVLKDVLEKHRAGRRLGVGGTQMSTTRVRDFSSCKYHQHDDEHPVARCSGRSVDGW